MRRHFWAICLFAWALLWFTTPYDFFYTVKPAPSLDARLDDVSQGELGREIALPLLAFVAGLSMLRREQARLQFDSVLGLAIVTFLGICGASMFWADDPYLTARRLAVLGMVCVIVAAAAIQLSIKELLYLACVGSGLTLACSIAAELYLGTFRPWASDYFFAGVAHSNQQGINVAVFVLSISALARSGKRTAALILLAIFGLACLYLTRSRTAVASCGIAWFCCWWFTAHPRRKLLAVITVGALLSIVALAVNGGFLNTVKNSVLLGRADEEEAASLTKRIPLWQECIAYLSKHPVIGYGYDSFFDRRRVSEISSHQEWAIGEAHNGFLEMALGVGILGGAAYTLMLALGLWQYIRLYRIYHLREYLWGISILIWFVLNNLLETVNVQPFLPSLVCLVLLAKGAFIPAFSTAQPVGLPEEP